MFHKSFKKKKFYFIKNFIWNGETIFFIQKEFFLNQRFSYVKHTLNWTLTFCYLNPTTEPKVAPNISIKGWHYWCDNTTLKACLVCLMCIPVCIPVSYFKMSNSNRFDAHTISPIFPMRCRFVCPSVSLCVPCVPCSILPNNSLKKINYPKRIQPTTNRFKSTKFQKNPEFKFEIFNPYRTLQLSEKPE